MRLGARSIAAAAVIALATAACAQHAPADSTAVPSPVLAAPAAADSAVRDSAPAVADSAGVDSTESAEFVARFEGALVPPAKGPAYRRPSGVTTDFQGNVFVADTGNHRILQFDARGRFVFEFGGYGWNVGELSSPTDACAREGFRLFVADAGNDRVQQFDIGDLSPEGAIFPFEEGEGFSGEALVRPTRLDVDDEGRMYVSDPMCHCVWIFTPTGELVTQLGGHGVESSRFLSPAGVAVASKGRVYVADAGNRRIQAFDPLGNWIASWGGPREPLFVEPSGIDLDAEGNVVIADRGAARVVVLSPRGIRLFAFGGPGDGPGSFRAPVDVAVAPDGSFLVVDQQRETVERYRLVRDGAEHR
jgi:DNA-binding beta-propeller fold protein YncE